MHIPENISLHTSTHTHAPYSRTIACIQRAHTDSHSAACFPLKARPFTQILLLHFSLALIDASTFQLFEFVSLLTVLVPKSI